jgi:photosystem II stability/assembly factor-like uncharacterized protein
MTKNHLAFLFAVLVSALFLTGLLVIVRGSTVVAIGPVLAGPSADTPVIQVVSPDAAPNHLDTSIAITGTGFVAGISGTLVITPPTVSLGQVPLKSVVWISSTRLDAVVPWGLVPGVYTLTVVNTDGEVGLLPSGFTVTQGIGVWTTGGPYGGSVNELAIDPNMTSTIYANLDFMGLFKSENSGESWRNLYPGYVTRFALKPGNAHVLYLSGGAFLRSTDGGDNWQVILDDAPRVIGTSPISPDLLYIGNGANIQRSLDGGDTWATASGDLPPDVSVSALAVDPSHPEIVYVGASSGQIYKTVNGGVHWQAVGSSFGETWWRTLKVDLHFSQRLYASGWHGSEFVARSLDGGLTWEPMVLNPNEPFANDIQIHPTVSGTVYALTFWNIHQSIDGGATWQPYYMANGGWALGLNPQSGLPNVIGHNGKAIYYSADGGISWQVRNNGLAGVRPHEIVASPVDLRYIYVAADDAGGFVTNDGGQSWRAVTSVEDNLNAAAVHPESPTIGYLGGMNTIYKTTDGGQTWVAHPLPAFGQQVPPRTNAIEIDPHDSVRIYVGTGDWNFTGGPEYGWLYRSVDAGESWEPLTVTFPISSVTDIVIDPADSQTIYVATGRRWVDSTDRGSGIIKTTDGGATWQFMNQGLTAFSISRLAINPDNTQILYAGANLYDYVQEGGLFRSTNGGMSWEPIQGWLRISGLEVDPLITDTVYAGGYWWGLFKSTDAGANWQRVEGALGWLSSLCLEVVEVESRTVIYAGVSGGVFNSTRTTSVQAPRTLAGTGQLYGSGVYQLVIDRRQRQSYIYLPLVMRN